MNIDKEVLNLFNCMVTTNVGSPEIVSTNVVTDFSPNANQLQVLTSFYAPLNIKTLFSVEERTNGDVESLLRKQLLHYIEVYTLNNPGLFDLEVSDGVVAPINYVKGITEFELQEKVQNLLYTNAPINDSQIIKEIISHYNLSYDVNKIKNNELRVILFDTAKDIFDDGDDAVRYIVYVTTDSTMLIKSPEVLSLVSAKKSLITNKFISNHTMQLARVFNRHKKILLAIKNSNNKQLINYISRLSKTFHLPIKESINKNFIALALNDKLNANSISEILDAQCSIRDQIKFLNLLEYKKMKSSVDMFIIRNGKIHFEEDRKTFSLDKIEVIENVVLASLSSKLNGLKNKKILLDSMVDYGLPISRKQALGRLPTGTLIDSYGESISSGIYWHNDGGARDLDLSGVDVNGNRIGWGNYSGYSDKDVIYSGDVTSAENGAMEFLTSEKSYPTQYNVSVNIFSGKVGSECELVVGTKSEVHWIGDTVVREKFNLSSNGFTLGVVKNGSFMVLPGRINNKSTNFECSSNVAIANRACSKYWTIKELFNTLNIAFDTERDSETKYDYDLSYKSFSYDKLEDILYNR